MDDDNQMSSGTGTLILPVTMLGTRYTAVIGSGNRNGSILITALSPYDSSDPTRPVDEDLGTYVDVEPTLRNGQPGLWCGLWTIDFVSVNESALRQRFAVHPGPYTYVCTTCR